MVSDQSIVLRKPLVAQVARVAFVLVLRRGHHVVFVLILFAHVAFEKELVAGVKFRVGAERTSEFFLGSIIIINVICCFIFVWIAR